MTEHEEKVRKLLDETLARRLQTGMTAGEQAAELAEQRQRLATVEQSYSKAYKTALDSGWTERELRNLGLSKPPAATAARKSPNTEETPRSNGHA